MNHPEAQLVLSAAQRYAAVPRSQDEFLKRLIDEESIAAFGIIALVIGGIALLAGAALWLFGVLGSWALVAGASLFVLTLGYYLLDRVSSRRNAVQRVLNDRLVLGYVIDCDACLQREPGSWGPSKVIVNCDPGSCLDPAWLNALSDRILRMRAGQEPCPPDLLAVLRSPVTHWDEIGIPREIAGHDQAHIKSTNLSGKQRPNGLLTLPLVALLSNGKTIRQLI